jgi:hypothetical protein
MSGGVRECVHVRGKIARQKTGGYREPGAGRGQILIRWGGHCVVTWMNAADQRLAILDFPSGPFLSRVRCIAWFCAF